MQWTQGFPWAMTTCVLRTQAHDDLSRAASLERVTDDWDDWDEWDDWDDSPDPNHVKLCPDGMGWRKSKYRKYAAIVLKQILIS